MTIVLLEGVSDVAAVEALAARAGVDFGDHRLIDMGGATNVGRYVERFRGEELAGLCDAGEQRFFARALERVGLGTDLDREGMASLGFFVCVADLEDELIRALGVEGTERVIESQGQLDKLRTFENQPYQRTQSKAANLRRFFGTTGGRKERYASAMVSALETVPKPLARLIERL